MHLIATAYEGGHGVEKSEEKAHIWRRMAEQAGFHSPDTIFKIAIAHFQGTDRVPRDVGKVLSLEPEIP
jgi:TPR repeat protein